MPALQKRRINKDDTRTPLSVALTQSGQAQDITGHTIEFWMERRDRTLKVQKNDNLTGRVIIDNASQGLVTYLWDSPDVDEPGEFYAYFRAIKAGGEFDTFPIGRNLQILVSDHAQ